MSPVPTELAQIDNARFVGDLLRNPHNRAILAALPKLDLPDAWLVAGCLFQTIWNLRSGRPPTEGIKDYDLFYFDVTDFSAEAERVVQHRVDAALGHLGVPIEAKNQARVHTWYEDWFGHPYEALRSSRDGIECFLVCSTCVGVRLGEGGGLEVHAPHGLPALYAGELRPNPRADHRDLFLAKTASYRERWPWLQLQDALRP